MHVLAEAFRATLLSINANRFRAFLLVNVTPEKMEGRGIRASADGGDGVKVGEAFDAYVIAK